MCSGWVSQAQSWSTEADAVTDVYTSIKTGYTKELTIAGQKKDAHKTLTYGEITSTGADMLLTLVDMTDGVFVDLGSGIGRLVHHVATSMPVKLSIGIELVEERHNVALQAQALIETKGVPMAEVQFVLGDLLDPALDSHYSQYTHIFICSLCFPDSVLLHVVDALQKSIDDGTAARPKWLFTQRKLPFKGPWVHTRSIEVPCTWSASVNFHIYKFFARVGTAGLV